MPNVALNTFTTYDLPVFHMLFIKMEDKTRKRAAGGDILLFCYFNKRLRVQKKCLLTCPCAARC